MSLGPREEIFVSRSRTFLLLALLAAYALAFQGARGLWSPDEGRYVDVAIEMLRTRDWLHPFLHPEVPHYTKPPLTYWAIASSIAVFGRNEWAARLPNSIAYLGTVLLLASLGRHFLPRRPWLPALVYATFAGPFLAANVVNTDTILTFWETLGASAFVAWWSAPPTPRRTAFVLGMWTAFGFAFLTKGPPGLLPLVAFVAFVAFRERARLPGLFHPVGIGLFVVVGATWYVAVALSRPELWSRFLEDEVVARVATGKHHRNSEWYGAFLVYGPMLLVGALPWVVSALGKMRVKGLRSRLRDERNVLLGLWLTLPTLVFLLSRSRLPLYVLPLFVPLALVAARSLPDEWPQRPLTRTLLGAWVVVLVGIRGAASLPSLPHKDDRTFARELERLLTARPREVVFVGTQARYGLSLYLDTDVELCDLEPPASPVPYRETLEHELAEKDHVEPRVFVAPRYAADDVGSLLAAWNPGTRLLGYADGLAVWAGPESASSPRGK